jgi:carbamoyltransferase
MTLVLGLNAFHGDSSACLLADGELIAAAEEERFRRVKHWAGFPSEAIRYCLTEAGARMEDVGHVAINQDRRANAVRKAAYALLTAKSPAYLLAHWRNKQRRANVSDHLMAAFPSERFVGQVHAVEHHLAHLASAYLASPFPEATAVSVDGFGDFASAAWGYGNGNHLSVDGKVYFPHSLGAFYQSLTQFLGFLNYGDEYKVMGLAPYGEPRYLSEMRRIVQLQPCGAFRLDLAYFVHARHKVDYEWAGGEPHVGRMYTAELEALLGHARKQGDAVEQRHCDLARSVQAMYEEAFFHLLNALHRRYGGEALALAGGCAMNSVANGKVYGNTPFRRLYIQSAAGDSGGAIGAAYVVWNRIAQSDARTPMEHAYWGPAYDNEYVRGLLLKRASELRDLQCTLREIANEDELCTITARVVADGKVTGWFQGRMEWGPRALGNRSIVCDPRRANMKDILNAKIKRRESFRPFAPSILREAVSDWFEIDDDVPFMMQVYPIRPEKRAAIPAVTHIDGSGRLQTVHRETNPSYYRLIEAFRDLTGVPIVLNTSFNENEPVVCKPEEALECFLRTRMDVLVMGNHYIERAQSE